MIENTIALHKPIENGSERITDLTFAEPTAKEMMLISANPTFADMLKIASMLTNQPERVLYKLSVRDTRKVVEHTVFLLADGP